jgi:hypothetical protein
MSMIPDGQGILYVLGLNEMGTAITRLLSDVAQQKMISTLGTTFISETCGWNQQINSLESLLKDLIRA